MKRVVFLFVMISAMLLSSQTVKADKLKYYYYYTIDTSSADHFRVKLLVADLVGRDTWIKDGYIRAYAKKPYTNDTEENGEYIDIAKVYTYDQDGN